MKQNILQTISGCLLGTLLLALPACNDNDGTHTVYIPNAGTLVKVNYYIEDEPHVETFTVKVTPNSYPNQNPEGASTDVTVHVAATPDKVAEYNAAKGTDYAVLPENAYTVSATTMIKAGSIESDPITIALHAKGNIEQFVEYLLPISIVSAEGMATDECCQTMYFLYRGSIDASSMELLDRSTWTVLNASSEEPREGDWGHSGLKEACIDGDLNTFWGTDWSTSHPQPPHWIILDLGTQTNIQGIAIRAREEGYDGPKTMTLEVSDNGEEWKNAGEFKDIPAKGEFRSFLPEAVTGSFVKVTITSVNGGPHVTVSELNLF